MRQLIIRAKISSLLAQRSLALLLKSRHWEVIEADLSGYLDTIPHADLLSRSGRGGTASIRRAIRPALHGRSTGSPTENHENTSPDGLHHQGSVHCFRHVTLAAPSSRLHGVCQLVRSDFRPVPSRHTFVGYALKLWQ